MIKISAQYGKYLVWNSEDASKIRSDHRIIGSLIGCVPYNAFQSSQNFLPLQLCPEEAKLLMDKGVARIVSNRAVSSKPSPESVEAYWSNRNSKCAEQIKLHRETYDKLIREKAENLVETTPDGHAVWLVQDNDNDEEGNENSDSSKENDGVDSTSLNQEIMDISESSSNKDCEGTLIDEEVEALKEAFIVKESAKYQALDTDCCMVQLFTECPWKNPEENVQVELNYPETDEEQLKYAVFKDLWEKGFYITSGLKYGGHYLVYQGDPMRCKASYIVQCILRSQSFQAKDIITYGRVGNQAKKTFVLASVNDCGLVEYISLNWASHVMSVQK